MATRCEFDNMNKDISSLSWQECSDQLQDCDRCVHYHYCQKVCELNDRIKELEE